MRDFGPWKIRETHEVYCDPYVRVTRDDVVRPDGNDGSHVKVFMKPGVSVLPLDREDQVYLTNEFHYAIGRESLELVSGGTEPGEDPEETAQRELAEELGILAGRLEDLGSVDPFTTIIESPTRLFLATDLSFTEARPDGTEKIECVKIPFELALEKVLQCEITHGPSCLAIMKVAWKRRFK